MLYGLELEIDTVTVGIEDFTRGSRIAPKEYREIIRKLAPYKIIDLTCSIRSASLIFGASARSIIGGNDDYFAGLYSDYRERIPEDHLTTSAFSGRLL